MAFSRSDFAGLLLDIGPALHSGNLEKALRLADRACRLSPSSPLLQLMRARVLLSTGQEWQALKLLDGQTSPSAKVVRADCLRLIGAFREAAEICRSLIDRCAIDSLPGLSRLVASVAADLYRDYGGWCGLNSELHLIGEADAGCVVLLECESRLFRFQIPPGPPNRVAFNLALPPDFSGRVEVSANGDTLLGSGFLWPPDFDALGWVALNDEDLLGEVHLGWIQEGAITIVIQGSIGAAQTVVIAPAEPASVGIPFSIPLTWLRSGAGPLDVSILLPNGELSPLTGSPVALVSDRSASSPAPLLEFAPEPINSGPIDIVIPVYSGREQTIACLESVLATIQPHEGEIIVINDRSPDAALLEFISTLEAGGRATVIGNDVNLGFAGSVNRGLALHLDRDVVILNADTEVFGNWLARLREAACEDDRIGTVTPFGNAASILSFPGGSERLCTRAEAAEWDHFASSVNAGRWVDLPVGVGFCLYIRRACLDDVGDFDTIAFGKGYGEENDLCLRASKRGWRHVAATNVFVRHEGGSSFGKQAAVLKARNRQVLNARYPGYDALIEGFVAADPLREARRAIQLEQLRRTCRPTVAIITLALPGGVAKHVHERQMRLAAEGYTVLVVKPLKFDPPDGRITITISEGCPENLVYHLPTEIGLLRKLMDIAGVSHIEFHHFLGHQPSLIEHIAGGKIPYDVYIHDYSWLCPRITLLGGDGVYCGEPPINACESCVETHGSALYEEISVAALRDRSAEFLSRAARVITPTEDTRARLCRYFPGLQPSVIPWEPTVVLGPGKISRRRERIRIAIIGSVGLQKGYRLLLACARDSAARNLPLEFVVIGYTIDDRALLATGRTFITGPYAEDELDMLLSREDCDAAFYPSVSPETWCYTLTSALTLGLPILALDFGAIAERLRAAGTGTLISLATPPAAINDILISLVDQDKTMRAAMAPLTTQIPDTPIDLDGGRPDPAWSHKLMDETTASPEQDQSSDLNSSVQLLPLPEGLFVFKVSDAADLPWAEDMTLPMVHVGEAPIKPQGSVEFLSSPASVPGWLCRRTDAVVVRVGTGGATLLLTSVTPQNASVLAIEVRQLDTVESDGEADRPAAPTHETPDGVGAERPESAIGLRILVHVSEVGDVVFVDGGWAGCLGKGLPIEALSIVPADRLSPEDIQYCTLAAGETDQRWISNGELSPGNDTSGPVVGFAVRAKSPADASFDCICYGRFVSGAIVGPVANGRLCTSSVPDDPLEGFRIVFVDRNRNIATEGSTSQGLLA